MTDALGNVTKYTYDSQGRLTTVTDAQGNVTAYEYTSAGKLVKITDPLGNEAVFAYNANDQLVSMDLHRVDGVNGADEHQVSLYEYDGRNLVTKEVNAAGGNTLYVYDGNGNMISKTDADGYVTEYTYNSLDLVSHISYNGTKEVSYQYNKVGELVKMDDWLGTTTFELDLLNQLKKVTDHKGNVVEYTYDEVGNQTNLTYPDKATVSKSYDALGQLTQVTDAENEKYTYTYDDAGNVTKLVYPNGWVEDYTYDAEGNLLKTVDTDPFHNNKKSTKYEYKYDAEGNLVSEYKRDTTAANRALTTTYGYDALNRLISAHEEGIGVNTTRTYQYDTLGNLIREEQDGCIEYKYNGAHLDESTKCGTIPNSIGTAYWDYTYDGRGNLVSKDKYTRTTTGMDWQNEETYIYDETNRLVQGKNEDGEVSLYTYNGLGVRVGRELIMKDNTHGYTDFHDRTPSVETGIDKPEVAVESYVVDYTTATRETLTMHEEGGFDYRWVYGLDKLSVKITSEGTNWWGQNVKQDILKDYLHQDRLGSTTNLTDKFGRVVGRADYNEWGEITYKDALDITSSYRRIWPQSSYTGHDWDDVLGMYYAKARFYDPDAKRFVAMDPVKGRITEPMSLVQYLYVVDNPLRWVDPEGKAAEALVVDGGYRYVLEWAGTTSPLIAIDGPLPIGDILYGIGLGICVYVASKTSTNQSVAYYSISNAWNSATAIGTAIVRRVKDVADKVCGVFDQFTCDEAKKDGRADEMPSDTDSQTFTVGGSMGGPRKDDDDQKPTSVEPNKSGSRNIMTQKESELKHIFRDEPGHFSTDTPENRALLESTANDPNAYLGMDKYGSTWYATTRSDQTQIWVKIRNSRIVDGGINNLPLVVS